jgi:hypothetical protein
VFLQITSAKCNFLKLYQTLHEIATSLGLALFFWLAIQLVFLLADQNHSDKHLEIRVVHNLLIWGSLFFRTIVCLRGQLDQLEYPWLGFGWQTYQNL